MKQIVMTIAVAAAATVTERFTRAPLPLWRSTGNSQTVSAVCSVTKRSVSDSPKIGLLVSVAHLQYRKDLPVESGGCLPTLLNR